MRSGWIAFGYYLAAGVLAALLLLDARATSDGERAISALDSAEEKTDSLVKHWLERFSLGFYEGAREKAATRAEIEAVAAEHRARMNLESSALAVCSLSFLFLLWLSMRTGPRPVRARVITHVHGVAGVCLVVGLMAPMLTIIAQQQVAMLGQVVLHFESKSILTTVRTLFSGGNYLVAVLLGVFSVLVPVAKLLLSLLALLAPDGVFRSRCTAIVRMVGKWSMTDVFVVAILLSFLAMGNGGPTDARLGPGLYFFAAYGLLSFIGGMLLSAGTTRVDARHP